MSITKEYRELFLAALSMLERFADLTTEEFGRGEGLRERVRLARAIEAAQISEGISLLMEEEHS